LDTLIAARSILDASISITASRRSTIKNPSTAMNGIRNAAASGGSAAFRIAITSAVITAPPNPSIDTPGTTAAAASSAAAATSHVRRTGNGR
jgi:hypothetical protein